MSNEANIWQPRKILELSGDTKSVEELIVAQENQTLFSLTTFAYAINTGALEVHKNGLLLTKDKDWVEQSDTTFTLLTPCSQGDQVVATGKVGITGEVEVRETDIFISNLQALRDYIGSEVTIYVQGGVTTADGKEAMFSKVPVAAAPGTYVDDNERVIVPTGGDGSIAWLRDTVAKNIPITIRGRNTNVQQHLADTATYASNILRYGAKVDGVTIDDAAITSARGNSYRSIIEIPEGNCVSDLNVHQKYIGLGRVYKSSGEPNRAFLHVGTGDTEKDTVPVAGIIRQDLDDSGWYYINDSGHEPNGFLPAIIEDPNNEYRLLLEFSFVNVKIGAINITTDTWYASQSVTTGQGVNNKFMWLEFYKPLAVDVNNTAGVSTVSSFFGDTVTTTKNADGTITIDHPTLVSSSSQAPQVTNAAISSVSGQVPVVRSYDTTSLTYGMYSPFSGTLTFSGGSWNVSTPATDVPTAQVVGDTIELSHQTLRSLGVQVAARHDSPYVVSASPSGTNKTLITIRDFTGAVVTPNLDNMKLQYHAQDLVLQEVPYGNCIIRRDACPVKPKHLFGSLGNFWIEGTLQV